MPLELFSKILQDSTSNCFDKQELDNIRLINRYARVTCRHSSCFSLDTEQDISWLYQAAQTFQDTFESSGLDITFCDAEMIETFIPKDQVHLRMLRNLLKISQIKELNIVSTPDPDQDPAFIAALSQWAPVLQTVKTIRIKFSWMIEEVGCILLI